MTNKTELHDQNYDLKPDTPRFISGRAAELREISELYGIPIVSEGSVIDASGKLTTFSLGRMREKKSAEDRENIARIRELLKQYTQPHETESTAAAARNTDRSRVTSEDITEITVVDTSRASRNFIPLPESPLTTLLNEHGAPDDIHSALARRVGGIAGTKSLPYEKIERTIDRYKGNGTVDWKSVTGSLATSVNNAYRKMRGADPK